MSLSRGLINIKLVFIIIIICLFILGAVSIYFGLSSSSLSSKLKSLNLDQQQLEVNYQKAEQENREFKSKYLQLQQDYKTVSGLRDNLSNQVQGLLAEGERAKELEENLEKLKKDMEALENEKQEAINRSSSFKEEIKRQELEKKQMLIEKKQLEEALSVEKEKSGTKRLEQEILKLQKENKDLLNDLKPKQAQIDRLKTSESNLKEDSKKLKGEIEELRKKLEKLTKSYADAVLKNKSLEREIYEAPKKFAEIARQNKVLIRETANTHYNLGVFYLKNKEYSRALAEFEKTVQITPDDAYAHFNIGYIYAEYIVNRPRAIEHFRHYLRLAKSTDKDLDWVKKYIITWQSYDSKEPMK
jgi:chromosome segregation ATPase